jgi:hypothetical protein
MTAAFYVAHATSGRTRIRWAGDAAEKGDVAEIAQNIAGIEGVDQASPRVTTGSIIIEHEQAEWPEIRSRLEDRLSLKIGPSAVAEPGTAIDTLNHGVDRINGALKGINTDLGSLSIFLLLVLAVTQAVRGQVMGSSVSFLWYAVTIIMTSRGTAGTAGDTATDTTE